MNYKELQKANALYEKIEMTKKFQNVLDKCKVHHSPSEDRLVFLEINGQKQCISSITYEKIMDVIDDERSRYEKEFENFLSTNDEVKNNKQLYEEGASNLAQLALNLQQEYGAPIQTIIDNIAYVLANNSNVNTLVDNIKNKTEIEFTQTKYYEQN